MALSFTHALAWIQVPRGDWPQSGEVVGGLSVTFEPLVSGPLHNP